MTSDDERRPGPLSNLRILELGHFISVPLAARMLADLGAEVIKVEPPGSGDTMRRNGGQINGRGLWWSSLARNKRLITLDLRQERGQQLARDLAARCDAVLENFRAGQLERWGLGWDALRAVNPRLVLVRVSAFGQTGPYRDRVAFAPVAEAAGGLTYITGDPTATGNPFIRANVSLGDSLASLHAAFGVMAALYERDGSGTGVGRCVDVAMYESVFNMLDAIVSDYGALGRIRQPSGTTNVTFQPSSAHLCKNGKWLFVAASSKAVFDRLMTVIGRPDLIADPRFQDNASRVKNGAFLNAIISGWAAQREAVEAERILQESSVPATRIFSAEDCATDPHYLMRKAVEKVSDPLIGEVLQPGITPKFDDGGSVPEISWAGGELGADNQRIYQGMLGLGDEAMRSLKADKVI